MALWYKVASGCQSEILGYDFTSANVDDRVPVPRLTQHLKGLLFGDRGYIKEELFNKLLRRDLKLVTGIKSNMKQKLLSLKEKILLKKRSIVETAFSVPKERFELEHTRHRSPVNACVHLLSTLVAYCFKTSKRKLGMM